jgi:hypothetical protein
VRLTEEVIRYKDQVFFFTFAAFILDIIHSDTYLGIFARDSSNIHRMCRDINVKLSLNLSDLNEINTVRQKSLSYILIS